MTGEGECELFGIATYTDMTQIYEGRASTASCVAAAASQPTHLSNAQ